MLEKNPKNELARFSLAKAWFDAGRFNEAKPHFEQALQAKPDWMMAQILLGKCWLELGDKSQARQAFERGLKMAIDQHHEGPQAEMEALLSELS